MRLIALTLSLVAFLIAPPPAAADFRQDFALAADALKKNKRDEALVLVTKAMNSKEAEGSDLGDLHYFRADLLSQLGKLDESIAEYAKVIDLVPDHAASFHDRALVLAQQKKYAEALDDLSRAQFLIPQSPFPYFNRGRVYELMGKKNEAIGEYRKARALEPRMKEPQDALRRLGVR